MDDFIEETAKTVNEAIDLACSKAGVDLADVDVEIIDVGSKGIFGLGGREAKVRIKIKEPINIQDLKKQEPVPRNTAKPQTEYKKEASKAAPAKNIQENKGPEITAALIQQVDERLKEFLKPVLRALGVDPQSSIENKDGILWVSFSGGGLGILIGRRGETLNALQYLANLCVNRGKVQAERVRLVLDVAGYRESREETLMALARKMADKAVRTGRRVELEPMSPHERRIVHMALQDDRRVDTSSQGEEPYRRVIIRKKRPSGGGGNRPWGFSNR
ncbi:MAG: Jag N-terminal domain-containing protein [Clostridiales bacterium]|nr:Jag N-terminal domain-containing protein [Clostridiales bacterium]